ncbi:hypothetical protein [Paraglaciecola arctica]|uniref:glycosyl-4,4'-diaponeurosporenoate acyltransferase CrtO family protein n=1 Tax=Paraglaciecola arctica TaxID=1128911 RepID=UPI00339D8B41
MLTFFKRNLLLTDLILFRLRNKKQFNSKKEELNGELQRLLWQTCRDETTHLVFLAVQVMYYLVGSLNLSLWQWIFIFPINLYANVYPIFVQRHNRMRYQKLLTRQLRASL